MRHFLVSAVFFVACGRSGSFDAPGDRGLTTTCVDCTPTYVKEQGLVVHEWGTFTSVVASDGTLLPGLHHEEEDLPGFVADRMVQQEWPGTDMYPNEKMETPVTYFYAPGAMQVSAKVAFPKGLLTQWFPYVKKTAPYVYYDGTDPWLSSSVTAHQQPCPTDYTQPFHDGLLDWGTFDVLDAEASVPLASPLGETSWGFARNTAANPIRVRSPLGTHSGDQHEKFLFYRGLGAFELPLLAQVLDGHAVFSNRDGKGELGMMLLMSVNGRTAGFTEVGDLAAGKSVEARLPVADMEHSAFVAALKAKLTERLAKTGLYADEAKAMVDTWERAYFLTPGTRLLYLLPQAHTDALIPLTITPEPKTLLRTMVIRVELTTPAEEAFAAARLEANDRAFFMGKGRFAEPVLTRALQLSTGRVAQDNGAVLLDEVRSKRRWAPLAAE